MRVLFVVTSYWAIGEMEIALQFAKGIKKHCEVLFWIPRKHEQYVYEKGVQTVSLYFNMHSLNKVILLNIEETFAPDYIILSDYLNYIFCEKHYGLTLESLDSFSGQKGAFDLYNQTLNPRCMDTYGFRSKLTTIDETKMKFILYPSPLLDAGFSEPQKKRFAVSLVNNLRIRTEEEKLEAKYKLGLDLKKQTILVTHAEWQATYKKYKIAIDLVQDADKLFNEMLGKLSEQYEVIFVGKKKEAENSNIQYFQSLSPNLFGQYITATDMIISRNIISTSFAKMILKGIKGVVLVNSDDRAHPYKCKMFPVGWYDYISSLEEKSLYFQLFRQLEMFQKEKCLQQIENVLRTDIDLSLLQKYHLQLQQLKSPKEIMSYLSNEG